mmetsp:Transcript_88010/g.249340  ORF Transcript_88010/g.249340 Transcript_88010/m.249340 type:complete len:360 (-) Transcript_88010:124-1203(-)
MAASVELGRSLDDGQGAEHVSEARDDFVAGVARPGAADIDPILRCLLLGTADPHSPLRLLRGHGPCIQQIWCHLEGQWREHIVSDTHAFVKVAHVQFPDPTGISINMMPFVMGDKASVPFEYHSYWPLIEACRIPGDQKGQVGYLTVDESFVEAGQSQRRRGLHVERSTVQTTPTRGGIRKRRVHHWGRGFYGEDKLKDGIYMASSLPETCRLWHARVKDPEASVGHLGDIEHLRRTLGGGTFATAGDLVWLTDCTPHESVPLRREGWRQFFRLVTSPVEVWYEQHSTRNRLGVEPAAVVLQHNKFADEGMDAPQDSMEPSTIQSEVGLPSAGAVAASNLQLAWNLRWYVQVLFRRCFS